MALSATPTPWYRPPPFVDNIRGWDKFYLNSPRPSPSARLALDLNFVVQPNSHGQNHPILAFTPEIFSHRTGSPSFFTSSRKTLKTSLFYYPRTTTSPKLLNEATQSLLYQQNNHHRERSLPSPAPSEPPGNQGAGASNQGRLLAELRSQKHTSEGREGTRFGRCKEGRQLTFCVPRWLLVPANDRGVSCQCDPQVRRSGRQRLRKRFRVTTYRGPEESRHINRGQRSKCKRNTC